MKRHVFIGVAWPYVNGDLHIGHLAGYLIPSDVVARFERLRGNEVLMVSGSDCFGTPITLEADARKITPEQLVAEYHPRIVQLFKDLQLSFDLYTLTLNDLHKATTQEFFLRMLQQDLIIRGSSDQYFSPQENRFLPDRYVEGTCPHCAYEHARSDQCDNCSAPLREGELINPRSKNTGSPVEMRASEHYFIDWPKLQPFLEGYVEAKAPGWRNWVAAETKKWLKEGLKPRAITRDLNWGVEIPADRIPKDKLISMHEQKRIYVWFDAVIGYFSASLQWAAQAPDRNWEAFWKDAQARHYYFMGKDNLVFHTLFWPGQLRSYDAGLHLPDVQGINSFLTCNGQKFSKSRGITVSPYEVINKYGLDPVRFYMCLNSPENDDADYTPEGLNNANNSILVAKIGNFAQRTLTLAQELDLAVPAGVDPQVRTAVNTHLGAAAKALEEARLRSYAQAVVQLAEFANKYISDEQPWSLKKPASDKYNPERFKSVMVNCLFLLLALDLAVKPSMPGTSEKLEGLLGVAAPQWSDKPSEVLEGLLPALKLSKPEHLFKNVEL